MLKNILLYSFTKYIYFIFTMCKLIDLFIPEWLALSFFLMPSESDMEYREYLTGNHAGVTLITLLINSLSLYSRK